MQSIRLCNVTLSYVNKSEFDFFHYYFLSILLWVYYWFPGRYGVVDSFDNLCPYCAYMKFTKKNERHR